MSVCYGSKIFALACHTNIVASSSSPRRVRERYNGAPMLISRSPGAQPTNQPLLESCNGRVTVITVM